LFRCVLFGCCDVCLACCVLVVLLVGCVDFCVCCVDLTFSFGFNSVGLFILMLSCRLIVCFAMLLLVVCFVFVILEFCFVL